MSAVATRIEHDLLGDKPVPADAYYGVQTARGRYAGFEGGYTFIWRYLVAGEGDTIQGRSVDLKGRVRVKEAGR